MEHVSTKNEHSSSYSSNKVENNTDDHDSREVGENQSKIQARINETEVTPKVKY